MSYEYKDEIIMNLKDYNAGRRVVVGGTNAFESKLEELDHVYSIAVKTAEYKVKANLWEINKKRFDEYEAKAIILDRVKEFATEPPFLLANNEHEDYELYAYDQILRLIEKYESGESDE